MAIEVLDIIDTVVKIGLGATIASISTYVLTSKNHKHEKIKSDIEDRRGLLKEIADCFEKSDDATTKFAVDIQVHIVNGESDLTKYSAQMGQSIFDSTTYIGKCKANANLLGQTVLFEYFDEYIGILNKLHSLTYNLSLDDKGIVQSNNCFDEINILRNNIYPEISSSYDSLKA